MPSDTLDQIVLTRTPWATKDPLLQKYYDEEWGTPLYETPALFERLSLEGFQAGLSWITILKKRDSFREAFAGFDPAAVARFSDDDVARLMDDERIIRNRRKIEATIKNAAAILKLEEESGADFATFLWSFMPERSPAPRGEDDTPSTSPESERMAKALKKRGFSFVGPTVTFSLMAAIGMVDIHVVDSHRRGCSGLWRKDGSRVSDFSVR